MNGFKIIRNPNEPTTKHIRATCRKTKGEFIIRLEHEKNGWYMVYATKAEPLQNSSVAIEHAELKFNDGLFVGSEYSCPFCGDYSIVRCGNCGGITCNDGGKSFNCAYCDNFGEVSGKITSVYLENSLNSRKK